MAGGRNCACGSAHILTLLPTQRHAHTPTHHTHTHTHTHTNTHTHTHTHTHSHMHLHTHPHSRCAILSQRDRHCWPRACCYPEGCVAATGKVRGQRNARESLSKLKGTSPQRKMNVTSKSPVGDISVVTLIRTDTTLDHSQKAEKVWTRDVTEFWACGVQAYAFSKCAASKPTSTSTLNNTPTLAQRKRQHTITTTTLTQTTTTITTTKRTTTPATQHNRSQIVGNCSQANCL